MREALFIFRKDVRHLWPRILFAELWIAAAAIADIIRPQHPGMVLLPLDIIPLFVSVYLLVCVMHEEKTVGDTRYWLTRPISRQAIVIAKLMFIVVFLAVPTAIGHTLALSLNGISPLEYWRGPAADVLFSILTWSIAAWAMASVTTSTVQCIWASLLWIAGFLVTGAVLSMNSSEMSEWPGFDVIRSNVTAAVMVLCGASVVWLMYMRRNRRVATAMVVVSAGLILLSRLALPWHVAFAIKEKSSGRVDSNAVHLSFDADAKVYPPSATFGEGAIGIYLPVVLSGVPGGMQVTADRTAIELTSGGTSWQSRWDRFGQLICANSQISDPYHQQVANGPQFLYVHIGQSAYERLGHSRAHLRVTVAFTLDGDPSTVRLSQAGRFIPGAGFCAVHYQDQALFPSCLNLFEPPQPAVLLWRHSPEERFEFRILFSPPTSDLRTASMLWYGGASLAYAVPAYPSEVYLQVRRPIAYLERTLDIPSIRLADY
jgi:hypothetical protein